MQLLMMTYCQDIMTNFKICTNVLVNHLKDQLFHYNTK